MDEILIFSDEGIKKFMITILTNMRNISSMALYLFIIVMGVFLVIAIAKALAQ